MSLAAAHPRSRGEHYAPRFAAATADGSSPLARGTPPQRERSRTRHRLIPARAGNTPCPAWRGAYTPAHPRSRGEHSRSVAVCWLRSGSSPLARGTPPHAMPLFWGWRLIPARAGNTSGYPDPGSREPAHPRSRGEHPSASTSRSRQRGSSPLARGTRRCHSQGATKPRLIPARAGNTLKSSSEALSAAAHPRSRGEHRVGAGAYEARIGSSPLARGTLNVCHSAKRLARLIPARAGNTVSTQRGKSDRPAHPRSRGEHTAITAIIGSPSGSSPLARGTRL